MKFGRVHQGDRIRPVAEVDGRVVDLTSITDDIDPEFLGAQPAALVRRALADGRLPAVSIDGARFAAAVGRPGSIICIGQNYAAHARESGAEPPSEPIVFLKPVSSLAGPDDVVVIPRGSTRTDWEVELAVVIGRRASYLDSPDRALEHVAGFTVANDLSEREWQLGRPGGQWSKGKASAGFTPVGPWIVTPDEVDHTALRLRSWVGGESRQDSSTADLIFGVEHLIWDLSQYLVLEPGDLILTGTPEGVALSGRFPYLAAGDVLSLEIEGIGRQEQRLVAWEEGA